MESGGRVYTESGPSKKLGLSKNQFVKFCVSRSGKTERGYVHTKGKEGNPHKDAKRKRSGGTSY